jgi:feruloyl esterase
METNARKTRRLKATATLVTVLAFAPSTGATDGGERRQAANRCAALLKLALVDTVITGATAVPPQGAVPGYCRVLATVAPETDIEVRLPDTWQSRLLHLGGAGFDGTIPNLNLNVPQLQQGYALAGSNGGHRDPTGGPTRFLNDPTLILDFAYVAIAKTVHVAKAVIHAYYGHPATYSYFAGCSNGGRGAFNAAAKYADEYDGVVAGAPSRNTPGLISGWVRAGLLEAPSPAKLAAMYQAEVSQCDAKDGLIDGIISNPTACRFDPATLTCPAGIDNDSCLTNAEIQAVNVIRSDLELANGRTIYSRLGIGNPAKGFGVFMPLGPPGSPTVASSGGAFLQYIVYSDPAYDVASYDVNRDFRTVVKVIEGIYDFSANTAPLARYLRSGKKMIVWHGTEDTGLSHFDTVRTYEQMAEAAGDDAENARLYTPAGVLHCGGGPGADRFDMIGAITDWVENGHAPQNLIASKVDVTGHVRFTRPLCEYPKYPRYIGYGDPNDAASFQCVRPTQRRTGHDGQ